MKLQNPGKEATRIEKITFMKVEVLVMKTAPLMMKTITVYAWRWKRVWRREHLRQHLEKRFKLNLKIVLIFEINFYILSEFN